MTREQAPVEERGADVVDLDPREARHAEIAARLAAQAEIEERSDDPSLAVLQDARDFQAAAGEWELADALDNLLHVTRDRHRQPEPPEPRGNVRDMEDHR